MVQEIIPGKEKYELNADVVRRMVMYREQINKF
jgi:hypothetical protein